MRRGSNGGDGGGAPLPKDLWCSMYGTLRCAVPLRFTWAGAWFANWMGFRDGAVTPRPIEDFGPAAAAV